MVSPRALADTRSPRGGRVRATSSPAFSYWRSACCWLVLLSLLGLVGCTGHRSASRSGASTGARRGAGEEELRKAAEDANVVICVLDAARPDHMGCYGYRRPTTPTIDRLAAESFVFEQHFTVSPTTKLSTVSLFTGQYPDTHLAYGSRSVSPDRYTIARALRSAGLRTALFSSNIWVSPMLGVGAEFEHTAMTHTRTGGTTVNPEQPLLGIGGPEGESSLYWPGHVLALLSDWLQAHPRSRFFAYIHIMPPHTPYAAPKVLKDLFTEGGPSGAVQRDFPFPGIEPESAKQERLPLTQWINLYDANLRWADDGISRLLEILSERGVLDHTLLIVTADHGEAFGEHGYIGHNFGVYDELVHIPLLVRFPGGRVAGRVRGLTQNVDVMPTLCDLLGIACSNTVQGRSLLPLMSGEADKVNDYVFSRALGQTPAYLVRTPDEALMLFQGGRRRALFDLRLDPEQVRNVVAEQGAEARRFVEAFREFAKAQARPPLDFSDPTAAESQPKERLEVRTDEGAKRELRALGYLK